MLGKEKKKEVNLEDLGLNDEPYQGTLEKQNIANLDEPKENSQKKPRAYYAGLISRGLAFFIDWLMIRLIFSLISGLLSQVGLMIDHSYITIEGAFIAFLYFFLSSYFGKGMSIGRAIVGLQLEDQNGKPLDMMTILLRDGLGKTIVYLLPVLGLTILFTTRHENFMDLFFNTSVASLKRKEVYEYGLKQATK